jgi:histone demethylase JARID1
MWLSILLHDVQLVNTLRYGSGFPNTSDELRRASGWNLNKFATQPGSILQFLNESISGVVRPMMYIGMLFSSFCWHTEDNYLYSINYLHQGAPKTWYLVVCVVNLSL